MYETSRSNTLGFKIQSLLVLLSVLLTASCSPELRPESQLTLDTLSNGAVLVANGRHGIWNTDAAWYVEQDFRIGEREGAGPQVFGRIMALTVDIDGRIYVLDQLAHEVRVFDADGEYLRSLGGRGSGPGEIKDAIGLAWADEVLWVCDPGNQRFVLFDTAGAYVGTRRRLAPGYALPWRGGFDARGRFYDSHVAPDKVGGRFREILLRYDPTGARADTIWLPSHEGEMFELPATGGMKAWVPFTSRLAWTLDLRGYLWFGVTGKYRIYQRRVSGDTVRVIERQATPVAVTSAEMREELEQIRSYGAKVDADQIPTVKPAFQTILIDPDGYLWVVPAAPAQDDLKIFDIFDPEGRYLGPARSGVSISLFPTPVIAGRRLIGITTDSQGVQYVVSMTIHGR